MKFLLKILSLSYVFTSIAMAGVNINTATLSELQKFNGVGPSTAGKIIEFREVNGLFASCNDLIDVKGIGPSTLEKIKPLCIIVDGQEPKIDSIQANAEKASSKSIDINSASSTQLQEFNGVGPATAQKIIDYRKTSGPFSSCSDLGQVKGIGPATLDKISKDCIVSPAPEQTKKGRKAN